MKSLILFLIFTLSTSVFAGTGHSHGHGNSHKVVALSQKETGVIARTHVARLVKSEKIDVTWKSAVLDKSEKKNFNGHTEWVVTFNNEKGIKGKKLYIFLKESGAFVAANFSGK